MTITIEQIKQKQTELETMIKAYEEQAEAEFPKLNESYYFINPDGSIQVETYEMEYDEEAYLIGNCFRTQEEAKFAAEQLKVIAEMKRCGGVWKTKSAEAKEYYLYYAAMNNPVLDIKNWSSKDSLPYIWFPTEEAAQKAIDTIGEERLLKYWFCVEVEE